MSFSWNQIRLEDFASFQRLMGIKICLTNGGYWTEVRPFFFRPMVPWRPAHLPAVKPPPSSILGGYQLPLADATDANSWFNWFVYDEVRSYTPATLDKNPRRQLRIAQANFEVRQISELNEFKRQASRVYQAFHARTGYRTGSHRRDPNAFSTWAEGLFDLPEILVLGGYRNGQLGGVALSLLLEDTMYYASVFCDDESMKLSLYDLFWHTLRESAAAHKDVRRLFMGSYVGNPGLDNFKSLRGAKLVRQPAMLKLNPFARLVLESALPKQFARLRGHLSDDQLAKYVGAPIAL